MAWSLSWIRLDVHMPGHRKVRHLAQELGISRLEAVGALVSLWTRVGIESPTGVLSGWSLEDIEESMGLDVRGRPRTSADTPGHAPDTGAEGLSSVRGRALVDVLVRLRILDEVSGTLEVHGWDAQPDMSGFDARDRERKAKDAARKRKARAAGRVRDASADASADSPRTSERTSMDASADSPRTSAPYRQDEQDEQDEENKRRPRPRTRPRTSADVGAEAAPGLPGMALPPSPERVLEDKVDAVIRHYQSLGHQKAQLSAKCNRDPVRAQLRAGWTTAQLCRALDRMHANQYHRDNGYLMISTCFRNSETTRRWVEMSDQVESSDPFAVAQRWAQEGPGVEDQGPPRRVAWEEGASPQKGDE